MKKLTIHNPMTSQNRYHRNYNLFWDEIFLELKKKYIVNENRTFENARIEPMKVKLKKGLQEHVEIFDCECVIEDETNGDFYVLSVADQLTSLVLNEQKNPHLKKVLFSQYIPDQIVHHAKENSFKYYPWIYFPQENIDYNFFFEERKKIKVFEDKLFFLGSKSYRPIVDLISDEVLCNQKNLQNNSYFYELIKYKVALSIGGAAVGDLCYRDIEYMSLGIPFIKFDFVSFMNPPLIPNYHYISIPIPEDLPLHNDVKKDRLGNIRHANLIEKKFKEVINNTDFLNFISKNSKDYYEKYLSSKKRAHHVLEILELSLINLTLNLYILLFKKINYENFNDNINLC